MQIVVDVLGTREESSARISLLNPCRRSRQWSGRSGRLLTIALQDVVRVAPCLHKLKNKGVR